MSQSLTDVAKGILQNFGLGVRRKERIEELEECEQMVNSFLKMEPARLMQYAEALAKSKSQIKQDLFVLGELNFKRKGYFVDFGATNGVDLSNSHLLEKEFGWTGILAEPAKVWHSALNNNRSAHIETNCVWKDSVSVLTFTQAVSPEFSTINQFSSHDNHVRESKETYEVQTISLNDLLEKYKAPKVIDYLSIDTEGSEFDILNSFDFSKHTFRVITCEHNFTPFREKIFQLLSQHGYVRKFRSISSFDDWYVHPEHL